MWMYLKYVILNNRIHTQKYILYNSVYIRFKKRQNYLMMVELRIMFTSCEERYGLGRDTGAGNGLCLDFTYGKSHLFVSFRLMHFTIYVVLQLISEKNHIIYKLDIKQFREEKRSSQRDIF